jgi:hypothetical protein
MSNYMPKQLSDQIVKEIDVIIEKYGFLEVRRACSQSYLESKRDKSTKERCERLDLKRGCGSESKNKG